MVFIDQLFFFSSDFPCLCRWKIFREDRKENGFDFVRSNRPTRDLFLKEIGHFLFSRNPSCAYFSNNLCIRFPTIFPQLCCVDFDPVMFPRRKFTCFLSRPLLSDAEQVGPLWRLALVLALTADVGTTHILGNAAR